MSTIRQRPQNDLLIKHSAPADLCKVSILSRIAQALSEQAIKKTCQSYYFGSTFDLKPSHNKYNFLLINLKRVIIQIQTNFLIAVTQSPRAP